MSGHRELITRITDAELEILKAVWHSGGLVTSGQLREELGGDNGWDFSTIRTLLRRLMEKGALTREKREVYYYAATITETEFAKEKTKSFLHQIFGGDPRGLLSTMLSHDFLEKDEIEDLQEFWNGRRSRDE